VKKSHVYVFQNPYLQKISVFIILYLQLNLSLSKYDTLQKVHIYLQVSGKDILVPSGLFFLK